MDRRVGARAMTSSSSLLRPTLLRGALWLSLGAWFGSWAFFAFVVSRIAFQVLPGDVAGDLAGDLLGILHYGGGVAALIAAGAARGLGRRGVVVWLPIVLAVICFASELWLSPEIAAIRPSTIGAAATEETSRRFGFLHALSLGLFLVIQPISLGLIWLHARWDARDASDAESSAA